MGPSKRWLYVIALLAAAFVAVSSAVQAIRQGSWAPILSVGWIPAVIVATCPACIAAACPAAADRPDEPPRR